MSDTDNRNMNKKDAIYSEYREKVADFVFDKNVVSVFDDMIRRSVPGYAAVIAMAKVFAEEYAQENSNLYDLGCSLGASTLAMRKGIDKKGCRIIAVDNSEAMIESCKGIMESDLSPTPVDVVLGDIRDTKIENASVVVLNFTLQFIAPDKRDQMLKTIYDGLLPGGILILSEKIAYPEQQEQNFQVDMHHSFKRLNGYSDLEVSQKRKAIENVLIPDTLERHYQRLDEVGFVNYYLWFQCFNFVSLVAFKQK